MSVLVLQNFLLLLYNKLNFVLLSSQVLITRVFQKVLPPVKPKQTKIKFQQFNTNQIFSHYTDECMKIKINNSKQFIQSKISSLENKLQFNNKWNNLIK